jgi:hypothetical protein
VPTGSPEYSVRHPGITGHDPVKIRSLHALKDGKSIFVEIPQLHPVMQFHLYLELKTRDGQGFQTRYLTIRSFIRVKSSPISPVIGQLRRRNGTTSLIPTKARSIRDCLPRKHRLKLWEMKKYWPQLKQVELDAIAGLQYAQKELRVKAGAKVALTFRNLDPSMPHNVAIVEPDRLTAIMDASMKLAASPEGLAKHYVPEDKGVIALSPVLQSGIPM